MKKSKKVLTILLLVLTLINVTYGDNILVNLKAYINLYKINIDSKTISNNTITYNNSTYVKLEDVAKYLNKDIKIDNKTNIITLIEKSKNIKQAQLPTTLTNDNVSIRLNKIEQNDKLLKIYITYINNSDSRILSGDNTTMVVSDEKLYMYNLGFDYYNKDTNDEKAEPYIKANSTVNSTIIFPAIQNVKLITVKLKINSYEYEFKDIAVNSTTNKYDLNNNLALTNTQEIIQFLENNYSKLNTSLGETKFTFSMIQNNMSFQEYDYWIQVGYEYNYFEGAMSSIKYTTEQKNKLKQELKDFQYQIAQELIKRCPNKKIICGYYKSWYKYPVLQLELQTRRYFTWRNYNESNLDNDINNDYEQAKISEFQWYSILDNNL